VFIIIGGAIVILILVGIVAVLRKENKSNSQNLDETIQVIDETDDGEIPEGDLSGRALDLMIHQSRL